MRMRRLRLEFGMELRSEHPRMPFYFHDFHEVALWIYSRNLKPRVLKGVAIVVVKLVAVAVAFAYSFGVICLVCL